MDWEAHVNRGTLDAGAFGSGAQRKTQRPRTTSSPPQEWQHAKARKEMEV